MIDLLKHTLYKTQPWISPRLPRTITLPCAPFNHRVTYIKSLQAKLQFTTQEDMLYIYGRHTQHFHASLLYWLKCEAKTQLIPRLIALSQTADIAFNKASIRHQKRRLGSCSSIGNISLNAVLILFDHALIDYVILHELTHVLHMNHSRAFWDKLNALCPNAKVKQGLTQKYYMTLPTWAKSGV